MMLRIFIHVLFVIFLVKHANAQEKAKKKRLYETWVTKTDGTKLTGLLNDVDDTKLLMDEIQFGYIDVYAHEIEKIQFRKLYQPRTGMAIGAILGLITGVAIAVEGTSNINDATEAIVLYSIGLGALGPLTPSNQKSFMNWS